MHPVPGGEYPFPAPAATLVKIMPPPHCFHGPFVKIDDLMDKFADCPLPAGKTLSLFIHFHLLLTSYTIQKKIG